MIVSCVHFGPLLHGAGVNQSGGRMSPHAYALFGDLIFLSTALVCVHLRLKQLQRRYPPRPRARQLPRRQLPPTARAILYREVATWLEVKPTRVKGSTSVEEIPTEFLDALCSRFARETGHGVMVTITSRHRPRTVAELEQILTMAEQWEGKSL